MNRYERLLSEYENLDISERYMHSDGLYCDGHIWIRKDMPSYKKVCVLAEEVGHHETTAGDILDQKDLSSIKQENNARRWAYEKLLPVEDIIVAAMQCESRMHEMAEFLEVDETFLREAMIHYKLLDA